MPMVAYGSYSPQQHTHALAVRKFLTRPRALLWFTLSGLLPLLISYGAPRYFDLVVSGPERSLGVSLLIAFGAVVVFLVLIGGYAGLTFMVQTGFRNAMHDDPSKDSSNS